MKHHPVDLPRGAALYLPRAIDPILRRWSREPDRKPLILRGARQTGKTAAVRQLGKSFELFIELNLERFEDLALVRDCRSADELLAALSSRHNLAVFPPRTLLFLDEIQESPEAVSWLRFLREDHPDLHVIAAGSLLEVRLHERGFSFPVGRATFRLLRPFTLFELLAATDRGVLARRLLAALQNGEAPPAPLHQQALAALREYLLVGGMPEAVARWTAERNPAAVRRVHRDLRQALADDLQKYRGVRDVDYLEAAFDNLRHHYGLRFRYENFAPGYRSQRMKVALGKLEAALLIRRAWPTSSLQLPLKIRPRSAPKLLPLDVGLALYALGTGFDAMRGPAERLFDGRAAEMFVGQQLAATGADDLDELHFWVSESSRSNAELDFLLAAGEQPMPVEVKSGASGTLKSLHQFLSRSGLHLGVRLYAGPYADEWHEVKMPGGRLRYRLLSLPLYLAEHVPQCLVRAQAVDDEVGPPGILPPG